MDCCIDLIVADDGEPLYLQPGGIGPPGPPGANGTPNWRGNWNSTTNYVFGDAVDYLGSSYVANTANLNVPPPATQWDMLAQEGGIGPAGITWRGAWSSVTNYVVNDGVSYLGSSYVALHASLNDPPPSANWALLAAGGAGLSGGTTDALTYWTSPTAVGSVANSVVTGGTLYLTDTGDVLLAEATDVAGVAIKGIADGNSGYGVLGTASSGGYGVKGTTSNGVGVFGVETTGGVAIKGQTGSTTGILFYGVIDGSATGDIVQITDNVGTLRVEMPAAGGAVFNGAALAPSQASGHFYLPSCNGTPTSTPSGHIGTCPIIIDTSGSKKLWVYLSGAWHYVVLT